MASCITVYLLRQLALRTLHLLVLLSLLFPNLPARAAAPAPDETSAIAPQTQAANVSAPEVGILPVTQALTTTLEAPAELAAPIDLAATTQPITTTLEGLVDLDLTMLPVTATLETSPLPIRIPITGGIAEGLGGWRR